MKMLLIVTSCHCQPEVLHREAYANTNQPSLCPESVILNRPLDCSGATGHSIICATGCSWQL